MNYLVYFTFSSLYFKYWYNPDIHNFGNVGIKGNFHSILSPIATKIIDLKAYNGRNIRKEIYNTFEGDTLDMCCGTGFSTKPGSTGIDTSLSMLRFSKIYNPGSNYYFGNAENFGKSKKYNTVSCMFSFHEIPTHGREKIIRNCIRNCKKEVVIVDISTSYKPSDIMLTGEPYLNEYLSNMDFIMNKYGFNKTVYIENHVDIWKLTV